MGGTLIAISERGLDKAGNLRAFLIGGPAPGTFTIRRIAKFDITDAALLPAGDLLILERSFSWPEGLLVQIRRIQSETSGLVQSSMVRSYSRRTYALKSTTWKASLFTRHQPAKSC